MRQNARFIRKLPIPMEIKKEFPLSQQVSATRLARVEEMRAILDEAQRLAREGIDPDFFEQIRRASFGATLRALNSFENIAISMADGYFRGFDALRFPEAYASIEKADVERFLRENLTDSRRAISIIEPKKEG